MTDITAGPTGPETTEMPAELLAAARRAKGFMPADEGRALFETARRYGPLGPICEIGT